jgi:hypothetical protein
MYAKAKSATFLSLSLMVVLFYTSCRKNEAKESANAINKKDISVRMAKGLYESFTGASSSIRKTAASKEGVKSVNTTQCGLSVDSVVNTTINVPADATKYTVTGRINIKYICDQSNWNTIGYTLTDSLHTVRSTPVYAEDATVIDKYDAVTKNYNYGVVTVNGVQKSHIILNSKYSSPANTDQNNNFTLQNMVVEAFAPKGADITSGNALFVVQGKIDGTAYNFSGNIKFLGDHKVLVTFLDEAYNVDLISGKVTSAK